MPHRAWAGVLRQRAKKTSMGRNNPLPGVAFGQAQLPVLHRHLVARRHQVDVVGLQLHAVLGARDGQRRVRGQ
jgi:hypothetical protein